MTCDIDLMNLVGYTDHERAKWKTWLAADPSRLAIAFQSGARFPTIGSLLHHVFWVEERHLSRLENHPLPDTADIPTDDLQALFEFGDRVRANLRRYVTTIEEKRFSEPITFSLRGGPMITVLRR